MRRPDSAESVLELALPIDVERVAASAEAASAAIVAAVGLAGPPVPDRAGRAYELWLRARHVTQLDMETLQRSTALLEEALQLAPDDPRILATLAMACVRRAFFVPDTDASEVSRAAQLARAALTKGPDVAEAHLAMGHLELNIGEAVTAACHFRVAIARAPQLSEGHEYLGRLLLEANFPDLAQPRLAEALAITPHLTSARWEMARAHALAGRWADYDRVIEELGAWGSARAIAVGRFAMWRGDRAYAIATRDRLADHGLLLAPFFTPQLFAIYLDGKWLEHRDALLAMAFDPRTLNRRRRAFLAQLVTEQAAHAGDTATALRCLQHALDNGLFDLAWLDQCPLLASLRELPEHAAIRVRVKQRADAILDALYGDHEVHTIAETMLAEPPT